MRWLAPLALAACASLALARPASAQVQTVVAFDPAQGQFPENSAIDPQTGDIYVSFILIGEIVKISPTHEETFIAMPPGTVLTAGLVFNEASGLLYALLTSADPAASGVYEIEPDGSMHLYGHVGGGMLNGLAADRDGNLFAADSLLGVVWKIPAGGGEAAVWVDLHAPGNFAAPGPNGIEFDKGGDVYVSVSNQFKIVRIPVLSDGSAGTPATFVQGLDLLPDDFAFDVHGNLYLANEPTANVMVIHPDGSRHVLASAADGLQNVTSVKFGRAPGDRMNVYITNGGLEGKPALLSLDVGHLGLKLASWGGTEDDDGSDDVCP